MCASPEVLWLQITPHAVSTVMEDACGRGGQVTNIVRQGRDGPGPVSTELRLKRQQALSCSRLLPQGNARRRPWPEIPVN